ncbi:MAG: AI-2E family transporter [Erysipelotrichaceae bacterium]|nr:AI-2E family transporter [Erysipelotrichaceae bacterium]
MAKRKEFIINALYLATICGLIYFGVNYLLGILFPFIMAFVFAYATVRISRKIFKDETKTHRAITLIALYIVIILILVLLISLGINKLGDFIKTLPVFYRTIIDPYISTLENEFVQMSDSLPDNIGDFLNSLSDGVFEGLKNMLSNLTSGMVNLTTSIIKNAPEVFVSIIVMIVSSFYIVLDYENIANWVTTSLSDKSLSVFYEVKDFVENTLFKIIGSYAMIMGITFCELFIGLTLIGISDSGIWAMFIAFLDILPVLGVGTVMIPWGISCLITGRYLLGVELLVLYLVITVIRNIIEPHFVGTDLGLHPLATLISMIVGLRLFSFIGMFGLPLTLSFFMSRSKNKEPVKEEEPIKEKEPVRETEPVKEKKTKKKK